MKIIVTVGVGFIGSHIVDSYVQDVDSVVVIDNPTTGLRKILIQKQSFMR